MKKETTMNTALNNNGEDILNQSGGYYCEMSRPIQEVRSFCGMG